VRTGSGSCPGIITSGKCWKLPGTCPSSTTKTYRDCSTNSCSAFCDAALAGHSNYFDITCVTIKPP
jgi:hypothetical protein